MLAWWRHAAPRTSALAVVVVRDGGDVIGVAPWHYDRLRTGLRVARLLGTGHRVEPLALPGREREVASATASALAALPSGPGALSLDRIGAGSSWPDLLARAGDGGGRVEERAVTEAPVVTLEGLTYEGWLAGRSSNFRAQRARARRRLEREGAAMRMATAPGDIDAAAAAFVSLTAERWRQRPWSDPRGGGVEAMVREAARALVPEGRMRVWVLERGGAPVSVQIFLVAGGEVAYWNGGYDPRWSHLRPGFETIVRAIEHAFAEGDRRLDLGAGASSYKLRLADADDPLAATTVLLGGRDRALRAAQLLPSRLDHLASRAAHHLPRRVKDLLHRLRR
jgi:CelD/BcsL family acetyltransferase involved in cellulose biosynthesis